MKRKIASGLRLVQCNSIIPQNCRAPARGSMGVAAGIIAWSGMGRFAAGTERSLVRVQ